MIFCFFIFSDSVDVVLNIDIGVSGGTSWELDTDGRARGRSLPYGVELAGVLASALFAVSGDFCAVLDSIGNHEEL